MEIERQEVRSWGVKPDRLGDAVRCQACGRDLGPRKGIDPHGSARLYCGATCKKRAYRARRRSLST